MTPIFRSFTELTVLPQESLEHFNVLYIYIYVILICLLLFSALIDSGELCFSSLVLFGIYIYLYFMSDAPVGMS